MTEQTNEAPKAKPRIKRTTKPTAATVKKPVKQEAPKAAAPKAPKPASPKYSFDTGYDGPSGVVNERASRTPIDLSRFGQFINSPMTARDEAAIAGLRKEFGGKAFARHNIDAGILRRLGERGCITHVSGSNVDANATFKLTRKGLGQPEPRKAA